jgi:MFS family permease
MGRPSDARVVFRYPNFLYHSSARVLAVLGSEMQAVAVGWQVFGLTHRPLDLGLVGLAQFLPGILLFPVTGNTADRVPRQRILQGSMAAFTLVSALLLFFTIRGLASPLPIYLVLLLNGTARAFSMPANQALLPTLVAEEHFPQAVAWGSSWFRTATIMGPIAGGFIYGIASSPLPVYGIAALLSVAALVSYSRIRLKPAARVVRAGAPSRAMLFEGIRFIWQYKFTLALAHRPLGKRQGAAMLWCVFGFGVFTVVFGLSRNLPLSIAALALSGACDMVSVLVRSTMVQLRTPDHMRGRVSAVNMVFIGASNEVGQLESGLTAQWFGTVPAVVLGGVGTILVVAVWTWLFPELRQVAEPALTKN